MAILTHMDDVPLFSSSAEALLWISKNGYDLTGFHTHTYNDTVGYMAGRNHAEAVAVLSKETTPLATSTASSFTTIVTCNFTQNSFCAVNALINPPFPYVGVGINITQFLNNQHIGYNATQQNQGNGCNWFWNRIDHWVGIINAAQPTGLSAGQYARVAAKISWAACMLQDCCGYVPAVNFPDIPPNGADSGTSSSVTTPNTSSIPTSGGGGGGY